MALDVNGKPVPTNSAEAHIPLDQFEHRPRQPDNSMNGNEWLEAILRLVSEIADREYQKRVWLEGCGPEVSSFEEVVCGLFDDLHIDDFLAQPLSLAGMSAQQKVHLSDLRSSLDIYDKKVADPVNPSTLLNDPEWERVCIAAQRVLIAFGKQGSI